MVMYIFKGMDTQHMRVVNSEDKSKELKLVVYGLHNLMFKKIINACISCVILKIRRSKNQLEKQIQHKEYNNKVRIRRLKFQV